MKTPVALLIFNRPDTTKQVFAAIRQAQPETLLVVADGPRPDRVGEADACARARAIIEQVDWPCRVLKNYSNVNMGCKERVSSGLEWVFKEVEEAIILEDDCLPHPDFFPFCEKMLEKYRDDERIMMIGGTNYLLDQLKIPESYCFSRYFAIWGWASWRRAWKQYDITMKDWKRFKTEGQLKSFYSQGFMEKHVSSMMELAYYNRTNTWDIQWFYSCLFNNGLSIIPRVNLISNIGLVGTHTSGDVSNNCFPVFALDTLDIKHPQYVFPDYAYDDTFFRRKIKKTVGTVVRLFFRKLKKCLGVPHV